MKKFEYKTINSQWPLKDEYLNNWGQAGWELCFVFPKEKFDHYKYVFKRQLVT